jgi:hypothetical protein
MARQALKCCGAECEGLRILPRRIKYFEIKQIVGNGQSLLPLSAMQPAASRTALACGGAQITPYPPPLTAGCLAESGSRLPQSKSLSIPRA